MRIELASAGDVPLDDALEQLVLAAREAMTNAAKFSGADEISVYAESGADERLASSSATAAAGFDARRVAADRRGHRRVDRGPDAARRRHARRSSSAPGEGTEVELTLPRSGA